MQGNDGGNAIGLLPTGRIFASYAAWKDVRFGIGVFSNFGLSASWSGGWVGRYYTTKSTLIGLSILPGVGWGVRSVPRPDGEPAAQSLARTLQRTGLAFRGVELVVAP